MSFESDDKMSVCVCKCAACLIRMCVIECLWLFVGRAVDDLFHDIGAKCGAAVFFEVVEDAALYGHGAEGCWKGCRILGEQVIRDVIRCPSLLRTNVFLLRN